MKNVYLEKIDEAKRLYAELEADSNNVEARAKFTTIFEAIFTYFDELSNTSNATESDMRNALEWRYYTGCLNYELIHGASNHSEYCPPFRNTEEEKEQAERHEQYLRVGEITLERERPERERKQKQIQELYKQYAPDLHVKIYGADAT